MFMSSMMFRPSGPPPVDHLAGPVRLSPRREALQEPIWSLSNPPEAIPPRPPAAFACRKTRNFDHSRGDQARHKAVFHIFFHRCGKLSG
jgi:hypothetical protein